MYKKSINRMKNREQHNNTINPDYPNQCIIHTLHFYSRYTQVLHRLGGITAIWKPRAKPEVPKLLCYRPVGVKLF